MWLFTLWSLLTGVYCIVYAVYCIRYKTKIAAVGAGILGVMPILMGIILQWYATT